MHPSIRVCSIWAAVDIFLYGRLRDLKLKPGIDDNNSYMVDACTDFGGDIDDGLLFDGDIVVADA